MTQITKHPIPGDFIYTFFYDDLEEIKSYQESIENDTGIVWLKNYPKKRPQDFPSETGSPSPKNEKIFKWIDDCLDKISFEFFNIDKKLVPCEFWISKQKFGESADRHTHGHSIFSGILYLDQSPTPTVFHPERQFASKWYPFIFSDHIKNYIEEIKIFPEKGKLIIFPSYISHSMPVHRSKEVRYNLVFNTFFQGQLWDQVSCKLNVSVSL